MESRSKKKTIKKTHRRVLLLLGNPFNGDQFLLFIRVRFKGGICNLD